VLETCRQLKHRCEKLKYRSNFHCLRTLFIAPTDAHSYKYRRMLKQFKIRTVAPTCFGSCRNHHQGTVLCLAKTTKYDFPVLVGIDAVNVMAAYQPVVQAYGKPGVPGLSRG
jgi:hypothetical protein